ncbi:MAG: glycosyltransferase family 2 protein [Candidatus Protistobacter heckmanni]|nr:glycosyltransferase family 2 protein [Candidatus Protistobacter heckmanni]
MRPADFSLSCVVPAYNEAGHLAEFVRALHAAVSRIAPRHEILIVNDGSRDNTGEIAAQLARELPVRYLELSRNFGKEAALSAGIDHARGDAVLLIDGDFQHPLELVPDMLTQWKNGYDMVYGVIADRSFESGGKRVGTSLFYRILNFGSRVPVPPNAGDFRLMDRKVVEALRALPERNRFMKGLYAWVGFRSVALPFVPAARESGSSSFNLKGLAALALSGMTAFSTVPLRMWGVIGSLISAVALVYSVYIIADTLLLGNPTPGWATLSAGLMLFSGIQLLSIGILGEYLGRVYEEVKHRPIYLLARDEDGSPLK